MDSAEIRSLYVEALARAELASVSFVAYDGIRSTAMRTNEDAAQAAVDALEAAGLLPVAIDESCIGRSLRRQRRYATPWQEVAE